MSVSTGSFNLRSVVRTKLDASSSADPATVARELLDDGDIDPANYRDALLATLPDYVREQVRSRRGNIAVPSNGNGTTRAGGGPVRSGHLNQSTRWRAVAKVFANRVYVSGTWKFLGDCTVGDLDRIIADYGKRASENIEMRDRYARVKSLVETNGVSKVEELDPFDVSRALSHS